VLSGLTVCTVLHLRYLCSFRSSGPNWPAGGEIDILEGVNDYTNNQATLHTNPGCTMSSTNAAALSISGNVLGGADCAAANTGNAGCGIRASTDNSFGAGFNSIGGGIYASEFLSFHESRSSLFNKLCTVQWDSSGISVFFFPRGTEPSDIAAEAPNPGNWGRAQARWPASSCDPFKFFYSQNAIFDTTLWCVSCYVLERSIKFYFLQWRLGWFGLEQCGYPWSRTELCAANWILDLRSFCEGQWIVL
jgi:hypothetical protein